MPARLNLRSPSTAVNAVLGLAIAATFFWAFQSLGPTAAPAAGSEVRSVPVQQGAISKTVSASGTVSSARTASASFVTGGTVTAIRVKVGQAVKKGQVLAEVDPAPAQRTLDAAYADLDAAQDSLARAEAAGSDTTTAANEVTQAGLAVNNARAAVAGAVLKAPMAGTVTAVNGMLGSSSSGGSSGEASGGSEQSGSGGSEPGGGQGGQSGGESPSSSGFVDIADLARMQVTAAFAEADATKLKEKQAATITWNALSGTSATGKVSAVDPSATTANNVVTYGVTVTVDKVPAGAKVGQTVSVSVITGNVADAVYVNSAAITKAGNRHTVTVLSGGQQETRTVEIGLAGDSATQITSGVVAGELVVLPISSTTTGGDTGGPPGGGGFGGGPPGGIPGGGGPR